MEELRVVEDLICESSASSQDGSDFTDGELYSLTTETRAESCCVWRTSILQFVLKITSILAPK